MNCKMSERTYRIKPWDVTEQKTYHERRAVRIAYQKKWKAANPEKMREIGRNQSRKWRAEHPESVRKVLRAWYEKNHEKVLADKREYYQRNKERLKANARLNHQKNRERKKHGRCMSCESLLKEANTLYCTWCVNTYKLCPTKTQQSHA